MKTGPPRTTITSTGRASSRTDGAYEIHQLTFGPYDDINAVCVPGERIAFVTNQAYTEMGTRADEYNHARVVTQLATISIGGGDADRKLCSQNLSHTRDAVPHAGRPRRLLALGAPRARQRREAVRDEPGLHADARARGQHGKPFNSLVQVRESNTRNVLVGIATERENTIQAGALVKIDARSAARRDARRRREDDDAYDGPHAGRADATTVRRRSVATARQRCCPTGGCSCRGRTARSTSSNELEPDAARLRHLRLRPRTRAQRARAERREDVGSSTRGPSRRATSRRSSAGRQVTADATVPDDARLDRRQADVALQPARRDGERRSVRRHDHGRRARSRRRRCASSRASRAKRRRASRCSA